jgi:hypothetical protein
MQSIPSVLSAVIYEFVTHRRTFAESNWPTP